MRRKRTKSGTGDEKEPNVRRITTRKRGVVFSGTGISDASVGGGVADHPENDHPDINQAVVDQASAPRQALPPVNLPSSVPASGNMDSISNEEDFNPANRLRQVGRRSSEYEREYRLGLLSRLLMRKIPLDEIAAQLGISVSQVMRDRTLLAARYREAAKDLNIDEMVGSSQEFYEEVQAMSMRAASNAQTPMPMRLAAMRTALASNNDKHRFFQAAGVYDVLRFRRAPGGEGLNDVQRMMSLAEELMEEDTRDRREETTPNPLGEFSGGDSENLDL